MRTITVKIGFDSIRETEVGQKIIKFVHEVGKCDDVQVGFIVSFVEHGIDFSSDTPAPDDYTIMTRFQDAYLTAFKDKKGGMN